MKYKFLSLCFLLIFITSSSISLVFYKKMKENSIATDLKFGISQANLVVNLLSHKENVEIPVYKLAQFFSKADFRITFLNELGKPFADSQNNSIILEDVYNPFILEEKNLNYPYHKIVNSFNEKNIKTLMIFTEVFEFNHKKIRVVLSKELIFLNELQKNTLYAILLGMIISGAISGFLSIIFVNKIIAPITILTNAVRNIALGNFENEVIISSKDEIKKLGDTFNLMSKKIKQLLTTIEIKAENLQSIIDSLQASIFVVNSFGEIILVNKRAIEEFNLNFLVKNIFEIDSLKNFKGNIENAIENKKQLNIKISQNDKIYRTKINNIYDNELHFLITIQDITDFELSEKLRREFVSNASHELKTPITIISGFIETIKLGHIKDEKKLEYFINIIEKEIKRLAQLTENLLTLSKVEKILEEKREYKELNLERLFLDIFNSFENIASKKNIIIKNNLIFNSVKTTISEEWFRTIIGNLIDNSIKYSNNNSKIIIEGKIIENNLIFSVSDEGIGIPKEELNNIFRRFYRVDKSRNKKVEGNGLGLAIVKNMILKLNGKIEVESEVENGTTFTVTIPL